MDPLLSQKEKLESYTFVSNVNEDKPNITKNMILFDLLIEGYVRTQCYLDSDYVFAISIKGIITSYYMNTNNLSTLKAYINSKKMQKMLQIQIEKYLHFWRSPFYKMRNILFCLISFIASILAIIGCIGYYNESANYYIMHSARFTLIGASICLLHFVFVVLYRCIAVLYIRRIKIQINISSTVKSITETTKWLYSIDTISKLIMLIFYSVW
eukprot:188000_1